MVPVLVVTILLLGSACSQTNGKENLNDGLKAIDIPEIINSTLQDIINGLDEPLSIEIDQNVDLAISSLFNGTLGIHNLVLSGIKSLEVPFLDFVYYPMALHANVSFSSTLEVDTDYSLDSLLLTVFPLFGDGPVSIRISGLELGIVASINILGLNLKDLSIAIKLDSFEADIEGLLYDDAFNSFATQLINNLANDVIVPYINENTQAVSDIIGPVLKDIINGILSDGGSELIKQHLQENNLEV